MYFRRRANCLIIIIIIIIIIIMMMMMMMEQSLEHRRHVTCRSRDSENTETGRLADYEKREQDAIRVVQ